MIQTSSSFGGYISGTRETAEAFTCHSLYLARYIPSSFSTRVHPAELPTPSRFSSRSQCRRFWSYERYHTCFRSSSSASPAPVLLPDSMRTNTADFRISHSRPSPASFSTSQLRLSFVMRNLPPNSPASCWRAKVWGFHVQGL